MPEGTSEIPKVPNVTPESERVNPTRRDFLKGVAVAGAVVAVESTIGRVVPAEASPETPNPEKKSTAQAETQTLPTPEPAKQKAKERTPEQEAYDAKAACENLFTNVRKIEGMDLKTVDFASKSASGETDDLQKANDYLNRKLYVEAKASFQEVSNRLLALAAVRILNQIIKDKGLVYSWEDIDKAKSYAFNIDGQPLSEIRNYLDTCTPLVNSNIESYFWRGLPSKKDGTTVTIFEKPTYRLDLNDLAYMIGGFSKKDAEIVMGAFLKAPPEKPKYPDISGHTNYVYDWAESSGKNLRGHQFDKGLIDLIKDFFHIPPEERKTICVRASEITPTYR